MSLDRRSGEQRGRTNFWSNAQKNLRDANSDAASEKENDNRDRDKKEIAKAKSITNSIRVGVPEKEEGVAFTGGIAIAYDFAEKEKSFAITGRRNSLAKSEEEKDFTNSKPNANSDTASQEKNIAGCAAI